MFNLGLTSTVFSFNIGQVCPEKKIRSKVTSAAAVLSAIFPSRYCWSRVPAGKIYDEPRKCRYSENASVFRWALIWESGTVDEPPGGIYPCKSAAAGKSVGRVSGLTLEVCCGVQPGLPERHSADSPRFDVLPSIYA